MRGAVSNGRPYRDSLTPFSIGALFCRQGQFVDQAIAFDAGTPAFRTVVALEMRTSLANGQSLVNFGLGASWHPREGPFCHRGGEVPAADQKGYRLGGGKRRVLLVQRRKAPDASVSVDAFRTVEREISFPSANCSLVASELGAFRKVGDGFRTVRGCCHCCAPLLQVQDDRLSHFWRMPGIAASGFMSTNRYEKTSR